MGLLSDASTTATISTNSTVTAKHIEVIIQKAYLHSSSSLGHAMRNPVISIWAKVVIPVCTVILVLISVILLVKACRERQLALRNMNTLFPILDLETLNSTQQMESQEHLISASSASDIRGRQSEILLPV